MIMSSRLPSIHAIGKSYSVDMDEPPDLSSEDSFNHDDEYRPRQRYFFELEHTDSSAKALDKLFYVVQPGQHMCRRVPSETSTAGFTHCPQSAGLAKHYQQLTSLLENRARLHLVQDYTSRLNSLVVFVQDLQHIVQQEFTMWFAISHNCLQEAPSTKLEYLSAICEDLRIHMNHWNSIKQQLHTNKWLKPVLPRLCRELDLVRQRLYQLRENAIWWTDCLIRLGLQVLAHCDLDRFTRDSIWSITRGVEEFNAIVTAVRVDPCHESSYPSPFNLSFNIPISSHIQNPFPTPAQANSCHMGDNIKAIPFGRVLSILAEERSKYAAAMTHRFYTASDEFLHLVNSGRLPGFSWEDVIKEYSNLMGHGTDTSDYVSATGSHVSLSAAMLRVGDVIAPDLSKEMSPVIEFAQREHEFVTKFLHIVCDSTKMLKRPAGSNVPSPPKSRPPTGPTRRVRLSSDSDSSVSSSQSDPKRKSVSWGDAVDMSVVQQLSVKYMDLLWKSFGHNLMEFFLEHVWGGLDNAQSQLGHVSTCNTLTVMMVVKMVHQTCAKDLFPAGAVQSLQGLANKLEIVTAWTDWDHAFSAALASALTDKCQPVPLVENEYSTRTGRLLRDTFQPLVSLLVTLGQQKDSPANKGVNGLLQHLSNCQQQLVVLTLQHLLATTKAVTHWCSTKARHHLAGWSVGAFLLIIHSDLKLLADEVTRVLTITKPLVNMAGQTRNQKEALSYEEMNDLWQQIYSAHGQLQTLSGVAVKQFSSQCYKMALEYFEESMPVGKVWKRKAALEFPGRASDYVDGAVDLILEPVLTGVCKLKSASQISSISMAATAMGEAWTKHILAQKIKFSLHGAHQLHVDFNYMRSWLQQALQNNEVKQSIMSLDIFKQLTSIAELLKRQPRGRIRSRSRNMSRREESSMCCDLSLSHSSERRCSIETETTPASCTPFDSENELASSAATSLDPLPPEGTACKVPNVEEWLALRLHGNTRSWKIPSCFTATDVEV